MKIKTSWWSLTIQDYPNFKPNEADLEHIAKCIKGLRSRSASTRGRRRCLKDIYNKIKQYFR